jgi:hypothetical protein
MHFDSLILSMVGRDIQSRSLGIISQRVFVFIRTVKKSISGALNERVPRPESEKGLCK